MKNLIGILVAALIVGLLIKVVCAMTISTILSLIGLGVIALFLCWLFGSRE